jgi:RHS repeat-associated protein
MCSRVIRRNLGSMSLRSGTVSYYQQDALGSVSSLTDSAGVTANTYSYDSFGKLTAPSGTVVNPFQYAGRDFDAETGIYEYRARYYDPTAGRFLSGDPLRFSGGDVNFYAYVRNNPINLIDPFGLKPGDKYPSARCAGWNAENDYDPKSRHKTNAFPRGREYGGFIYQNGDGTYSYTDPSADNNAGVGTADSIPNFWNITIPPGTQRAGWYHTHGAFDPSMNGPGNPAPGRPGYNWHNDGNEVFSPDDMAISDTDLHGLLGCLGTPQGTVEEYMPIPGHPGHGNTSVLNGGHCGCGG